MSDHHETNYIKIYVILLVLLVISIAGPEIGIKWVTLITAFGIAIVKAFLVCKHFMHLDVQKKYVLYMLGTMIAFVLLFFFAVAPDVMKHEGQNWENYSAKEAVERGLEKPKGHGDHSEDHGGDSADGH